MSTRPPSRITSSAGAARRPARRAAGTEPAPPENPATVCCPRHAEYPTPRLLRGSDLVAPRADPATRAARLPISSSQSGLWHGTRPNRSRCRAFPAWLAGRKPAADEADADIVPLPTAGELAPQFPQRYLIREAERRPLRDQPRDAGAQGQARCEPVGDRCRGPQGSRRHHLPRRRGPGRAVSRSRAAGLQPRPPRGRHPPVHPLGLRAGDDPGAARPRPAGAAVDDLRQSARSRHRAGHLGADQQRAPGRGSTRTAARRHAAGPGRGPDRLPGPRAARVRRHGRGRHAGDAGAARQPAGGGAVGCTKAASPAATSRSTIWWRSCACSTG